MKTQENNPLKWMSVSSSAIRSIAYDYHTQQLHVLFKEGQSPYVYCSVSAEEVAQLLLTESVGKTFNNLIRLRKQVLH